MESGVLKDELDSKRLRVQITEPELLCKNQCGFYGTPQWNGLCSQCWRAFQQEEKFAKNRALLRQESLDEKRRTFEEQTSSLKALFPRSPSLSLPYDQPTQPSPSASNSSFGLRILGADCPGAQQQFFKYIANTFTYGVAKDLEKQCISFMEKIYKFVVLSKDDDAQRDENLSEMVQKMYRLLNDRVSRLKSGSTAADFRPLDFLVQFESYVCDHAYPALFCARTEEESADLSLQERIRSLHWVTFGFLETSLDFSSEKVQYFTDEAVTQIVDLNSHRPVWRKLECLISCSKHIFDALKESRSGAPASADEFLPVLIYVILKANPPLIQSNLNFISRYALPYRIMRGESGYYFTNLCCALQFIQNMNAQSLHLSAEEFDAYTKGQRVPPKRSSVSNVTMKSINNSLRSVDDVRETREMLLANSEKLREKIDEDREDFQRAVSDFLTEDDPSAVKQTRVRLRDAANESEVLQYVNMKLDQLEMNTPSTSASVTNTPRTVTAVIAENVEPLAPDVARDNGPCDSAEPFEPPIEILVRDSDDRTPKNHLLS